ncbi:hypothetical protein GGI20_000934 [Coemansia sp. BCRC 34301]|nr:hypothetical protein GGI20_000934 [Coemansia sp. BCRC 34301]
MALYEEECERQIRENAEYLASLGIEKPVPSAPKPKRQSHKKLNEEGEYKHKPEFDANTVSYRDDDYYQSFAYHVTKKKTKQGGPRQAKGAGLGRIYDSKLGSSCHQCRQKTIDEKIKCSSNACTVMFDYKCLLIRYNEDATNIVHSEWTCPKCRGMCSCSFCMKKHGKRPTGQLPVFIKLNGQAAAKKAIMCDEINEATLYPSARRTHLHDEDDGLELNNDDYNGDDTAACSDQGADSAEPKRSSRRQANDRARKKIAALAGDSDNDGDTMASWDNDDIVPDRTWNGWGSCPSKINCIVLITK